MVEHLLAGDAAGAAAVTRAHRERASRELLAIFEQFKLAQLWRCEQAAHLRLREAPAEHGGVPAARAG